MPTYPYPIASIHEKNPGLPAVLRDINLNQAIVDGQELDRKHLHDAKATAAALRDVKDLNLPQYAAVTEELIESAEWRARVIELVHAQNEYAPANLANNLQQINKDLHELKVSMRASQVENANALIRIRNHFNSPGDLSALQKTVPGSGKSLAWDVAPDLASRTVLNNYALAHPEVENADIGSIPAFFSGNIDHYQHLDYLKLIVFYNEKFSIVSGDGILERKKALRDWLTMS